MAFIFKRWGGGAKLGQWFPHQGSAAHHRIDITIGLGLNQETLACHIIVDSRDRIGYILI